MHTIHGLVLAAAGIAGAAHAVDGLNVPAPAPASLAISEAAPAQWRGRLMLGSASPQPAFGGLRDGFGNGRQAFAGARLLGDYYFSAPSALGGRASGFRATSGLIVGPRLGAWAGAGDTAAALSIERRSFGLLPPALDATSTSQSTVPYFGFGYNDRPANGRWGFSADVGVMALKPSSGLRYGRGTGLQTIDDVQRELRLAPMLQLGASYAF